MPNVTSLSGVWTFLPLEGTSDLPEDTLGSCYLVGAHHEERIRHIQYRVGQDHLQEGLLLEEGSCEVLQILDRRIVYLCPVHREVKAVLIPLRRISEVAGISAIADHEELDVLV